VTDPERPAAHAVRVPGASKLAHGEALRFAFQRGKLPEEGFVLRWGDALYAFANSCPHWSVDLDYGTGEFYDAALDRIVCKNHGALFHPRTGLCDWGPCTGHALERFTITPDGDDALVDLE